MSAQSPLPSTPPSEHAREPANDYQPSINRYARALIARIQKNQDDVEAIRLLEAHYLGTGDHPSLANLMEGWGDTLRDAQAAADAYLRAADAALVGLGDRARAKTLYERALSRNPGHVEALDRLLRLLADAQDHEREKQVLKYVAYQLEARDADPQHLASVLYKLGQVYEAQFGEPGKAAANYRKAIERNPRLVPALVAARRIYADVGNTNAVALLIELEVEATPTPDDKRALLILLAELREHDQNDLDAAVVALRRALKHVPSDVEALRRLGELLVRRSEREDAASDAIIADRHRAAEVFFQIGQTLGEPNGKSYFERALSLHPGHERAESALRELAARHDEPTQDFDLDAPDAAAELEPKPRDSAEAWLSDGEPEGVNALRTDELQPIEIPAAANAQVRPSSLPPRQLAHDGKHAFPLSPSLRAPRVPQLGPVRRSAPPPPPAAIAPSSSAPPPPPAKIASSAPPPPAYAEIPGADEPSEARVLDGRRTESTLVGFQLHAPSNDPAAGQPAAPPSAVDVLESPRSEAATETPVAAPEPATPLAAEAPVVTNAPSVRPQAAAIAAPQPRASIPPAAAAPQRDTPYPSHAASSRLRSAQDERVAKLMRSVREPRPAATTIATPSPAPAPAAASRRPSARPPAAIVRAEAVHEPVAEYGRPEPEAAQPMAAPAMEATIAATAHTRAATAAAVRAPVVAALGAPAPARPPAPAKPARACIVDGELLHDPARAPVEVNLGATTDSNFYVGFDNRLTDGGIFVATYNQLPIGSEVELLVTLPGGFCARAHGRVRLVRDTLEPFSDDVPGMCVELEAVGRDALELFERFAQKRAPLFIED